MKYKNISQGIFLERLHRFGALVEIDGVVEYVHVKNTGRCRELFIPGVKVYLEKSDNPERKTKYSLISVYKKEMLVNIDSQVPNQVVHEALLNGKISGFDDVCCLKREVTYGNSRFDIYYETESGSRGYIEVKGVTLDDSGTAMFPDAPTLRGKKHLIELADAKKAGFEAHVLFMIQYKPANVFTPNRVMDQAFADALTFAADSGVSIHAYDSVVTEDEITVGDSVQVRLV